MWNRSFTVSAIQCSNCSLHHLIIPPPSIDCWSRFGTCVKCICVCRFVLLFLFIHLMHNFESSFPWNNNIFALSLLTHSRQNETQKLISPTVIHFSVWLKIKITLKYKTKCAHVCESEWMWKRIHVKILYINKKKYVCVVVKKIHHVNWNVSKMSDGNWIWHIRMGRN